MALDAWPQAAEFIAVAVPLLTGGILGFLAVCGALP